MRDEDTIEWDMNKQHYLPQHSGEIWYALMRGKGGGGLPDVDFLNPQAGEILAMTSFSAIIFTSLEFKDDHFSAPVMSQYGSFDGAVFHQWTADFHIFSVIYQ